MEELKKIEFKNFELNNGVIIPFITLSYQIFGQPLGTVPIVVVNHALTGNSQVTGNNGWWIDLIGNNKTINTNKFTVIAFNIPGNGYLDNQNSFDNYKNFSTLDIATIFWQGLNILNITNVFAVIGGSLGGAIAWQMALIKPENITNLIPIATHFFASDWLIANVFIQDLILNNSNNPIHDARVHAMLLYRTPASLTNKFNNQLQNQNSATTYKVESWLHHHGGKLENRFLLSAYKLMNHLLKTTNLLANHTLEQISNKIQSNIHLVAVNTDYFFTAADIKASYTNIKKHKKNVFYNEIISIHGHDAFLIEFEQLNKILQPIFTTQQ